MRDPTVPLAPTSIGLFAAIFPGIFVEMVLDLYNVFCLAGVKEEASCG